MPCCDVVNRGAALYDNLVIFSTLDAQLVALDQDTGDVVWKEKIDDYAAGYSQHRRAAHRQRPAADRRVGRRVRRGRPRRGARRRRPASWSGRARRSKATWATRYDADGNASENGVSGTANKSWPGDLWKTGGAATWLGGTYDAKTGLAYFGTGNPAPWNSHLRKGDNLFSCSTVAIDVKTGQIKWHYQNTPNDGWDFDGVNEFVTFDMDGKRVGGKADRNGFFYVNDAKTGKLLNAFPFVKKITWATGIDLKTGRPNFVPENRPGDPTAGADGKKGSVGVRGAVASWAARTRCRWPTARTPSCSTCRPTNGAWRSGTSRSPTRRARPTSAPASRSRPINDDYIGALRAIDPKTGKIVWEVKNNAPLWGGVLTTGGNLVFWGTPEGYLKAADAKTGKVVWQFQTGSGVVAPPVTWQQGGEQYVAVVSGWGGAVPLWGGEVAKKVNFLEQGGMVWVFKLAKAQ